MYTSQISSKYIVHMGYTPGVSIIPKGDIKWYLYVLKLVSLLPALEQNLIDT